MAYKELLIKVYANVGNSSESVGFYNFAFKLSMGG